MSDAATPTAGNRKTIINRRVQERYDALMREGKHGHYETMFRVVHEELTRCANESYTRGMIDQHDEPLGDAAISRLRDGMASDRAETVLPETFRPEVAEDGERSPEPHWTDRYADRIGAGAHLSDQDVANKVRMLMRNDFDHEMVCVCARDRIAKLSREVRDLRAALTAAETAVHTPDAAAIRRAALADAAFYVRRHYRAEALRDGKYVPVALETFAHDDCPLAAGILALASHPPSVQPDGWRSISEKPERPMTVLFWYGDLHDSDPAYVQTSRAELYREEWVNLGYWDGKCWRLLGSGHEVFEDWQRPEYLPTLWQAIAIPSAPEKVVAMLRDPSVDLYRKFSSVKYDLSARELLVWLADYLEQHARTAPEGTNECQGSQNSPYHFHGDGFSGGDSSHAGALVATDSRTEPTPPGQIPGEFGGFVPADSSLGPAAPVSEDVSLEATPEGMPEMRQWALNLAVKIYQDVFGHYYREGLDLRIDAIIERIATVITIAERARTPEPTLREYYALRQNFTDMGVALRMIRDAVQEIGPVGCVRERDVGPPDYAMDAEEVIAGIQRIAERARSNSERDEMVEALAKAEAEVERLNKWADGFSDAQLKERRLCEELLRERVAENKELVDTLAAVLREAHPCDESPAMDRARSLLSRIRSAG